MTGPEIEALMASLKHTSERLESAVMDSGEQLLEYFRFAHLPPNLQSVSAVYALAAVETVRLIHRNPERTVALRKLLEGKDAAVRSAL